MLKEPKLLKKFKFKARVQVLEQVADAIVYLHEKNIRHWDIKPANILVDDFLHENKDPIAKLGDLGLSKE